MTYRLNKTISILDFKAWTLTARMNDSYLSNLRGSLDTPLNNICPLPTKRITNKVNVD